jgi:hypothetical protein
MGNVFSEGGELNRPRDSQAAIEKALGSPVKSPSFSDFPADEGSLKMAEKEPENPENPDRVRLTKRKPRRR